MCAAVHMDGTREWILLLRRNRESTCGMRGGAQQPPSFDPFAKNGSKMRIFLFRFAVGRPQHSDIEPLPRVPHWPGWPPPERRPPPGRLRPRGPPHRRAARRARRQWHAAASPHHRLRLRPEQPLRRGGLPPPPASRTNGLFSAMRFSRADQGCRNPPSDGHLCGHWSRLLAFCVSMFASVGGAMALATCLLHQLID